MPTLAKPLSDALLRKELPKLEPGEWNDPANPGFYIWVGEPNAAAVKAITFNLRIRVSKDYRPRAFLGLWKDQNSIEGLSVEDAKLAFMTKKQELKNPNIARAKKAAKCLPLGEAIDLYVERRKKGDEQTAPKGQPLPKSWDENILRFREMMADEIKRGVLVSELSRDVFCERKEQYLKACAIKGHERMRLSMKAKRAGEGSIKDHKLRPMFSAMGPMLGWFVKKSWLTAADIADLRPQQYPADTRFLYPGEWQAICPQFDALENEAGLFMRFIALTGSRVTAALEARWDDLPTWGDFETITHEGEQYEALVWVARNTKGSDSVTLQGEVDEPQVLLVVGESLDILKRLRVIWERNRREHPKDEYEKVFSREIQAKWNSNPSHWQRHIEEQVEGMVPWDRHGLRRTHATYMRYVGCPQHLVSVSLTHSMDDDEKAAKVTSIYTQDDAGADFGEHAVLAEVAPYLIRLQQLLRDFERGHVTPPIERLVKRLLTGKKSNAMRSRYKIDSKWIALRKRSEVPKLSVVK